MAASRHSAAGCNSLIPEPFFHKCESLTSPYKALISRAKTGETWRGRDLDWTWQLNNKSVICPVILRVPSSGKLFRQQFLQLKALWPAQSHSASQLPYFWPNKGSNFKPLKFEKGSKFRVLGFARRISLAKEACISIPAPRFHLQNLSAHSSHGPTFPPCPHSANISAYSSLLWAVINFARPGGLPCKAGPNIKERRKGGFLRAPPFRKGN